MSYRIIPNANDFISISQSEMQTNFEKVSNYVFQNHEAFESEFFGKHRFVSFTNQSDPMTGANEIALYNKNDTSSNPQMFYRADTNGIVRQLSPFPSIFALLSMNFLPGDGGQKEITIFTKYNIDQISYIEALEKPTIIRVQFSIKTLKPFINSNYSFSICPFANTDQPVTYSVNYKDDKLLVNLSRISANSNTNPNITGLTLIAFGDSE